MQFATKLQVTCIYTEMLFSDAVYNYRDPSAACEQNCNRGKNETFKKYCIAYKFVFF